jgi:hypothetical protein
MILSASIAFDDDLLDALFTNEVDEMMMKMFLSLMIYFFF